MGFIGIKATKTDFNAVIAKTIRKYRDISISEIKTIVSEGNYLYECDYVDSQGIEVILSINSELNSNGIATVIYEHDQETTTKFLNNLLKSYAETATQVDEEMDREALLEEGESAIEHYKKALENDADNGDRYFNNKPQSSYR